MQEIGEQLDSAILAHAILLQLMHCSIASCVLHIACCMLRWCKIPLSILNGSHISIIIDNFPIITNTSPAVGNNLDSNIRELIKN